jgi:hypothetical protein
VAMDGGVIDNDGATATVTLTLPEAVQNRTYTIVREAPYQVVLTPDSGDTIRGSTASYNMWGTKILVLQCRTSGEWDVLSFGSDSGVDPLSVSLEDEAAIQIPVSNEDNWEHALIDVTASYEYTPTSTASGATTDSAGYAIGATTTTLAAAGTGTLVIGDIIRFAGDDTYYEITTGDADVSGGGSVVFTPGLKVAISAAPKAIEVVSGVQVYGQFKAAPVVQGTKGVKRISSSDPNAVDTNTNANLCVYGDGTNPMDAPLYVKNRLGRTAWVTINISGKRSTTG